MTSPDAHESASDCGAFAPIPFVKKDGKREATIILWAACGEIEFAVAIERHAAPDPLGIRQIPPQPAGGSVVGAIIHYDYLFVDFT
jgi:hypothetical protein